MDDLWKYIRAMFEENYKDSKNPFLCSVDDLYYQKCICIPGVAVNYIANEYKLSSKTGEKAKLLWNLQCNAYLPEKESTAWNKDIANLKSQEEQEVLLDGSQFCRKNPFEYSYIMIRKVDSLIHDSTDVLAFLSQQGISGIELEFFVILAREYRTEMNMEKYVDMLFRLLFFLYPYTGIKEIKNNAVLNKEDEGFRQYNKKVIEDYMELIASLENMSSAEQLEKFPYLLKAVDKFIGAGISVIYQGLANAENGGDMKGVNEWLQEKMNDTRKASNRIQKLKKKI